MLLLNIADMIESRKRGADAVNNMFGTDWRVEVAKEIQYNNEGSAEDEGENSGALSVQQD